MPDAWMAIVAPSSPFSSLPLARLPRPCIDAVRRCSNSRPVLLHVPVACSNVSVTPV